MFKLLYKHMHKYKYLMLLVILFTVLFTLASLLSGLVYNFVIDHVINNQPVHNPIIRFIASLFYGVEFIQQHFWITAILMISIYGCVYLLQFLKDSLQTIVSEHTTFHLRNALFEHLQLIPYATYNELKTGDIVQRCSSDVDTLKRFIGSTFSELIYALSIPFIAVAILFSINFKMAFVSLIAIPLLIVLVVIYSKNIAKSFLISDEADGELNTVVQESLTGIRVVKAFNREQYEMQKFEEKNMAYRKVTEKLIELIGIYWSSASLIAFLQIMFIVGFGIFQVRNQTLTLGQLFLFVTYSSSIVWPITNLGRLIGDAGKAYIAAKRINEIFAYPIEDIDVGEEYPIKGEIVFHQVSFHYGDSNQTILSNIDLTIPVGSSVAIIGPTGSGKSSLVHLLCRLNDVSEGAIYIDGHNINTFSKRYLRKHIGIVLQEPFLFSKSIYDNIALNNEHQDSSYVDSATKAASIYDVIQQFDQGFHTLVGEKGVTLSGGQKQRVAIARTIIHPYPILIFDDSLSAVDNMTEKNIRRALKETAKDSTKLIITQRINTCMDADFIVVLEEGNITAMGTHQELILKEGLYKRIYEIQSQMILGGDQDD
ncbi:MAG: ABC transporter ATP-binding protein [Erysipelotrichaceae bacterium]|nr:ABC transporter ATP-binding protein [Erysipelotrichaceae bacterium]